MSQNLKIVVILALVAAAVAVGALVVGWQSNSASSSPAASAPPAQATPPQPAPASSTPPAPSQVSAPSSTQPAAAPSSQPAREPKKPSASSRVRPLPASKPSECTVGLPTAPVKLEVFSDYQCPACRSLYLETMRPLFSDYVIPGTVCVVYREFPLRQHEHSRQAALLAEASARLGQTQWVQVSDMLFFYQGQWTTDGRLEPVLAQALTAEELETVRQWAADPQLAAEVDRDVALGNEHGIRSTPTLLITYKGKTDRATGVVQYPILRRYLDQLLEKK